MILHVDKPVVHTVHTMMSKITDFLPFLAHAPAGDVRRVVADAPDAPVVLWGQAPAQVQSQVTKSALGRGCKQTRVAFYF